MKYQELLKLIATYGHGVFVIPMISEVARRSPLERWIYRNQDGENALVKTVGGKDWKEREPQEKRCKKKKLRKLLSQAPCEEDSLKKRTIESKPKNYGHLKICVLTKKGMERWDGSDSLTTAKLATSLTDIALINSYMLDNNIWEKYAYRPNLVIQLGEKKLGLVSNVWFMSNPLKDVDVFLATAWTKEKFLSSPQLIKKIARKNKVSKEIVVDRINRAITPRAFKYARAGI